jgi:glycosyltransferase involved in cell wall biosynthesis
MSMRSSVRHRRMAGRAVLLTHEPPAPAISGARIRTLNLMRQLRRRGWSLGLFSLHRDGDDPSGSATELREVCDDVVLARLPGGPARYRRLAAALAGGDAFQARYFFDPQAAATLGASRLLDGADTLIVSLLYMYPYLPPELRERAVLDSHNSETHRVASMASSAPASSRGVVARLQAARVREYEREVANAVACTLAVSERERRWFDELAPGRTTVVPNGVDCDALAPRDRLPAEPEVLFVGSMGYGANQDGVRWLLQEVLPHVARPDVTVSVVGAGPPRSLHRLAGRSRIPVKIAGFVPSTEPYFTRARLLAVPLRIGGGTRLKILESLARGVPVVSTSRGCEGLDLVPGKDLLVADDPALFAAAIERLLTDDELCRALARRGRDTVVARFAWDRIGDALNGVLEGLRPPSRAGGAP